MRQRRNRHSGDINIHYISSDPRSTLSPAISPSPSPSNPSHHLLPSVLEATVYIRGPFRDLWRKFSLAIIRRGYRHRDSWRTRPSVLHILPRLPIPCLSRLRLSCAPRPSRFPLSLFPSFARISRIAIFAGR